MAIERCRNEDGRGGCCELVKDHVGSPHRSETWEWDFCHPLYSGPRRPQIQGVWWPVYEEVRELPRLRDAQVA